MSDAVPASSWALSEAVPASACARCDAVPASECARFDAFFSAICARLLALAEAFLAALRARRPSDLADASHDLADSSSDSPAFSMYGVAACAASPASAAALLAASLVASETRSTTFSAISVALTARSCAVVRAPVDVLISSSSLFACGPGRSPATASARRFSFPRLGARPHRGRSLFHPAPCRARAITRAGDRPAPDAGANRRLVPAAAQARGPHAGRWAADRRGPAGAGRPRRRWRPQPAPGGRVPGSASVTPASAIPHGTMRSKSVRSGSQFSANPCIVTSLVDPDPDGRDLAFRADAVGRQPHAAASPDPAGRQPEVGAGRDQHLFEQPDVADAVDRGQQLDDRIARPTGRVRAR